MHSDLGSGGMVSGADEAPIDPARPIIDPHLHLWDIPAVPGLPQRPQRFLIEEMAATIATAGHNVTHSVYVECGQMYRAEGPSEWRSLGETEFATGMAAMAASRRYGPVRAAHRIVGNVDLRLGEAVAPVLEAHVAAAGGRFAGVRCHTAWSAGGLFGMAPDPAGKGVLLNPAFRAGARVLARMGLSLDVWCLHSQLGELIDLADAVPGLTLVLDHVGTLEPGARADEARREWRFRILELARRPNVHIKLGGLGMDLTGPIGARLDRTPSVRLAEQWRGLVEPCIDAFQPDRCMFESNFPPDRASGTYGATWNAFKRIVAGASEGEKDWLFRGTAAKVYGIE